MVIHTQTTCRQFALKGLGLFVVVVYEIIQTNKGIKTNSDIQTIIPNILR